MPTSNDVSFDWLKRTATKSLCATLTGEGQVAREKQVMVPQIVDS